jgi:hypothetical protein
MPTSFKIHSVTDQGAGQPPARRLGTKVAEVAHFPGYLPVFGCDRESPSVSVTTSEFSSERIDQFVGRGVRIGIAVGHLRRQYVESRVAVQMREP